ncbi:MAG: tRNA (adenosine(37)-N6)-threonylcarbamoyltransferase complex transferase subunit TsaD [Polyangiaceae bacterium]|nr:tRNA (adenosine(37)-N6)-threonylcarbamoyltransferase complex transferase subunit TsaD [Polyangiaceae bacterium]
MTVTVLGLETSCDETAAAVVTSDGDVLSDVVRSQVAIHAPYGGVVPEVAARDHAVALPEIVTRALASANRELRDVDGIAVTNRPGLAGALLVGLLTAKGLAWGAGKPLIGVDHLVGHLLAVFLRREGATPPPAFPFVALLVSGGHTAIYRVDGSRLDDIQELGATRDDAAGEAFDKVAKLLGLGYPGGPVVDRLAARGIASRAPVTLPRPMAGRAGFEMSFSGIKSAVARHVERNGVPEGDALEDLCAAFQETVVEVLVSKTLGATKAEGLGRIVLGGGVAANRGLRKRMTEAAATRGIEVFIPPLASCTDNAAMIAYTGALSLARGETSPLDLTPSTKTALLRVTRKGGGRR